MKRCFLLLSAVLWLGACSSVQISSDYDKQADFTKYKTYAFTEDALKLGIQELNRDRLIRAIESEMAAKGFSKSESPDILVDLYVKAEQKVEATATNTGGYGRYGYGRGFSSTHIDYNQYTEGSLFVNMIDRSTEKIVWQGIGTKTLDEHASADKREQNINYAVKQIFTKYPPK